MSISKAMNRSQGIVLYGTLYLSNDSSTYDPETRDLVCRARKLIKLFRRIESYGEKLQIWSEEGIYVSSVWIGDTSRIVERENAFNYTGHPKPEPDEFVSVNPTNRAQMLELNIKNIKTCIDRSGSFEQYKQQYLLHLKKHADSPFYEKKLIIDLQEAESSLSSYNSIEGWNGISLRSWYNSFRDKEDTLSGKDYEIFDELQKPLAQLPLVSTTRQVKSPYLLHLVDEPKDVLQAAKGHFLHQQIPFLRKLREAFIAKSIAQDPAPIDWQPIVSVPTDEADKNNSVASELPTEAGRKKSKKTTPQITTKQQMILLDSLGFLDASIIRHLTTNHKAAILSQLLNRSEQDIRGMLTYWGGNSPRKDYDCTQEHDKEKVIGLLAENNLKQEKL